MDDFYFYQSHILVKEFPPCSITHHQHLADENKITKRFSQHARRYLHLRVYSAAAYADK